MSTFERIQKIVVDYLGVDPEKVTLDADFVADFGADSLDEIELLMAVEEEFDVYVAEGELEKVKTVSDAVSLIDGMLADLEGAA